MAETLVTILTAHLLGDFILQTGWIIKHKRHVGVLLLHVAIVTIVSYLLIGAFHWQILVFIFLMHFIIDVIKVYLMSDSLVSFLCDQCAHLSVLIILAYLFPDAAKSGWWYTALNKGLPDWYFASLCFVSGLILAVPTGGILVGKDTKPFMKEIGEDDIKGLEKGGQYIGWLERFLVMLLLMINQPTGIGFLIAAKSILRFGEIKNTHQRKIAEYIIIGTFFSFGWALLIAVLTQQAIHYWLPPKKPDPPAATVLLAPPQNFGGPSPHFTHDERDIAIKLQMDI